MYQSIISKRPIFGWGIINPHPQLRLPPHGGPSIRRTAQLQRDHLPPHLLRSKPARRPHTPLPRMANPHPRPIQTRPPPVVISIW